MIGILRRNVLFPMWHTLKKDGVNSAVSELEQNQWLATPELRELQQRKLARLMSFAAKNVPYYRALLNDLKIDPAQMTSEEIFRRIRPLTKSIILREKKALVSEDLTDNKLRQNSTSGSTGEALRFFTDTRSAPYRQAAEMRSDSYTGWRLGDRIVRLWGAPVDESLATGLRGKLHGWLTGNRFLSSFDLSAARMDEYADTIRQFKPVLLVGYPGPLEELANHCRQREARIPSVKAIVSSAETLWPHQRELIEGTFGVKVFNRYGSREVGHIGSECEAHDGLHINVDRLLVEIVDDEGQPCAPEEVGRILVTDLDNFGMPLIRYDIGDHGALSNKQRCSCGRGLPLLKTIEGRTLEIVRTPDGRRIGGTFWTLLLRSRTGLKQFQVVQDSLDGVVINYVRGAQFENNAFDYFTSRIQDYCGQNFNVKFVEKEIIGVTGSGKRRLIVSNLKNHESRCRQNDRRG